jgi:hypothetical protein
MSGRVIPYFSPGRAPRLTAWCGLAALLLTAGSAWSQTDPQLLSPQIQSPPAQPQPEQTPRALPAPDPSAPAPMAPPEASAAPSIAPAPAFRPGLIDAFGNWLKQSADGVSTNLQDTQRNIDSFNKSATDVLTRLPVTGFAIGRAACIVASNGAPDCLTASDQLCREKGYKSGRSLATESAQSCPAKVYMPGYQRQEGDCKLETYVTRAACQ